MAIGRKPGNKSSTGDFFVALEWSFYFSSSTNRDLETIVKISSMAGRKDCARVKGHTGVRDVTSTFRS